MQERWYLVQGGATSNDALTAIPLHSSYYFVHTADFPSCLVVAVVFSDLRWSLDVKLYNIATTKDGNELALLCVWLILIAYHNNC